MKRKIAHITLVVKDYDRAIAFYTEKLGFELFEDSYLNEQKRWVVVGPSNSDGCRLLLAKANGESQHHAVGNQTGGRVFLFLETDDFQKDYQQLSNKGIEFIRPPKKESYGTVAVFKDLYGNLWDLIGPKG
ncbi:VOC family protein [Flavobacteriaceae bacterium TP-CH-4]|uniref:VOC family protein n=1 Tax=Pelagihabitans pacificus TaxID=2696054 RepID=A0A967AZ78_9FLAO|nr:VOC family protein [Pelagihabitans pacificus]NHF59246.1 VOC family protein [Pelagihabitans pacificus]